MGVHVGAACGQMSSSKALLCGSSSAGEGWFWDVEMMQPTGNHQNRAKTNWVGCFWYGFCVSVSQSLGDETLRRRFWGNLLRNLKAEKLQKLLVHLAVCCDGTWMVPLPILVPSVDIHEMSESKIKEKVTLSNCVSLYKIPCRHFVYE